MAEELLFEQYPTNTVAADAAHFSSEISDTISSQDSLASQGFEDSLFGTSSQFVASAQSHPTSIAEQLGWVQMWESSLLILIILFFCLYGFYRYGNDLRWSVRNFISLRASVAMIDSASLDFSKYVSYSGKLSVAIFSLYATGYIYLATEMSINFLLLYALSIVVVSVCVLASHGLNRLLSLFDYAPQRWQTIRAVCAYDSAVGAYFLALPISALYILPGAQSIALGILLSYYAIHVIRIILLNFSLKFSFLQSILYICAVELGPISIAWALIKHFKIL